MMWISGVRWALIAFALGIFVQNLGPGTSRAPAFWKLFAGESLNLSPQSLFFSCLWIPSALIAFWPSIYAFKPFNLKLTGAQRYRFAGCLFLACLCLPYVLQIFLLTVEFMRIENLLKLVEKFQHPVLNHGMNYCDYSDVSGPRYLLFLLIPVLVSIVYSRAISNACEDVLKSLTDKFAAEENSNLFKVSFAFFALTLFMVDICFRYYIAESESLARWLEYAAFY